MTQLQWNDAMSIGVPEIDGQHKKLIDIINRIEHSIAEGTAAKEIGLILKELVDYSNLHFQTEEAFMKSINYGGLAHQIKLHEGFRNKLVGYLMRLRRDEKVSAYEILYFLKSWTVDHMLVEDKRIGAAVAVGSACTVLNTP